MFGGLVDLFRWQRKPVGQATFLVEKLRIAKAGDWCARSSRKSLLCALKCATATLIHVDECESKDTVNRVETLLKVRGNLARGTLSMAQKEVGDREPPGRDQRRVQRWRMLRRGR